MSSKLIRLLVIFITLALILPIAWISYTEGRKLIGLSPEIVEVAGTGSMYPSFFWDESQGGPEKVSVNGVEEYRSSPSMYRYFSGIKFNNQVFFKKSLSRGDIVAFSSSKTREILEIEGRDQNLGFIKRIIALPGDTVELRDGYVKVNGEQIKEPYIRSPRSTYAGTTVPECSIITIPTDSYFVLGDNRKVSSDSRYSLGFVKDEDIMYFLPLSRQKIYESLWRDVSKDDSLAGTPSLSVSDFYSLLSSLTPNKQLEKSANIRGQALLKDDNTTQNLSSSLKSAGYQNTVSGEFTIYGYFTANELLENLIGNVSTKSQLYSPNYTDIGVSVINGQKDGCPTQLVVGHLGGYIPATYDQEMISSWQEAENSLQEVIPSWEKALGATGVDQDKLNELLIILKNRLELVEQVNKIISNREWITPSLNEKIQADSIQVDRANTLAKELNQSN